MHTTIRPGGSPVRRLGAAAAVAAVFAAGSAAAQGAGESGSSSLESITVTGSFIRRTDAETPSPVTTIDAAEISKSGMNTIADVIRSISADNSGTLTQGFSGAMAGGASGVSLRGLSVDATLVLLDGHRMAPYPLADDGQRPFVDVSSLPMSIVERVEVLKDGASALYGSDAIAGVVNIILRKEFRGVEVSANGGTSYKHDGGSARFSALWGTGDLGQDGHNLYANIEVRHQDAIGQEARGSYLAALDLTPWGGPDLRGGLINGSLPLNGTTYTIPGQVLPLSGAIAGNEAPFLLPGCAPSNLVSSADSNGTAVTTLSGQTANGCAWDTNAYKKIQPRNDGLNLSAHFTQNLEGGWQSRASANYFHSESEQYRQSNAYNVGSNLVPFAWAASGSGTVNQFDPTGSPILLPANHPDNPFNPNSPYFAAASAYYGSYFPQYIGQQAVFYGALTEIPPQHSTYKTDVYRLVEDVSGTVGAWDLSLGFGHITDATHITYEHFVRPSLLQAALNNGSYRVGANAHLNSPAVIDSVAPTTRDTATSSLSYLSANATRNLFDLPGGPMGLATGAELRRLSSRNPGQPYATQGDIQMDGSFFAEGSQNVYAAFAEVDAPLLKSLEADAALRFDHYQSIGNSLTPKAGFKWTPAREFAFRGTYSRGFRAPGIAESGNGGTGSSVAPAPADPLRCIAGGPNTLQDCGGVGSTIAVLNRSNGALQPEKSHSVTLGVIFEPVEHTALTVDYFRIRRDNEIAPAPYSLDNAIRSPAAPGSAFPGPVIGYLTPFVNASYSLASGIDVEARTRLDLHAAGALSLRVDATHLLRQEQTFGDQTFHYVGTVGPISLSGAVGTPATRGSATLDWTRGPVSLGVIYNYHGPLKGVDESSGTACVQLTDPNPHCYVDSFGYFTLYGQYSYTSNLEFTGTVTNVTNRLPPLDTATYGGQNYNVSLDQAGAIGRYFEVGFHYHL